jgi:hypothetical protein
MSEHKKVHFFVKGALFLLTFFSIDEGLTLFSADDAEYLRSSCLMSIFLIERMSDGWKAPSDIICAFTR